MSNYLTFEQIQQKCALLSERYIIEEDKFYDLVEHFAIADMSVDQKLLASFKGLLELVNGEIDQMEKTMNVQPSCQMGCAFCCYFPIIINEMEAKLMKAAIKGLPEERRTKLEQHLKEYFMKYQHKLIETKQLDREEEDFKYKYRKQQLPCIMLDTDTNQCMLYEYRPIPCRTYVNYADPQACAESLLPNEPVSFEFLYEQYMGAMNEFLQDLYEVGDTGFIQYPDDLYKEKYIYEWFRN
ncbi:YkgJ family cysteine cluster protein [Gracilibacillus oryzae]|uniref:YkgJ family cysteine cluster protein n=1 Tax=Gracilibacillus oryzae TaxID=1672701 RepID=A0A7C8KVV0_9BACI|nr:YkgJ family cysteine cluster protein [Gracilibacillus oryzae]KAB8138532.1 YkgJ family cysteine cluster protein [Gracilibacillus oryzae]